MTDARPASVKIPPGALPRTEADRCAWLRLARSRRVGPATFIRLLREFGTAAAALAALPGLAAAAGAGGYRACGRDEAEAEWADADAAGARPLFLGDAFYPPLLALLADPPPFLWAIGAPAIAAGDPVALVGSRSASALGVRMAGRLARDLGAAGFAVASGLARGIDAAAHGAALATGTVAVVAGGVDVVYPPENASLRAAIAERGLILSEMPMGTPPKASYFLRRNRIVSGLSRAVAVVEAAERSGALNTARHALDQGREVMAVPGHPLDPRAGGCNLLLREGATLIRSAADVLEVFGEPALRCRPSRPAAVQAADVQAADVQADDVQAEDVQAEARQADHVQASGAVPPAPPPEDLSGALVGLIGPVPVAEDILIRETGAAASAVAAALLELDLAGSIARHPGGLVSRRI